MWRTTSILEIKAWTASTSPDSKLRSLTIANSIGARAGHNPQRFVLGNSTIRNQSTGRQAGRRRKWIVDVSRRQHVSPYLRPDPW
jgi:hypothetical protein